MSSNDSIITAIEERLHPKAFIAGHHEAGIIAINKGAGLLSHPNPPKEENKTAAKKGSGVSELAKRRGLVKESKDKKKKRLGNRPAWLAASYDFAKECFSVGEEKLYLCNRLDSATSGILIVCRDAALAVAIKEHWAKREVKKLYVALLRGMVARSFEKWIDSIEEQSRADERGVRVRAHLGAARMRKRVTAKTSLRRIHYTQVDPKVSMVVMQPITGRTHQLRVQSQLHKYPIVGDGKYGDFRFNRALGEHIDGVKGRMFLHSYLTEIKMDFGDQFIEFAVTAPVPASYWNVIKTDLSDSVTRTVQSMLNE
ncbi:MAG: pseudouridine synthase [Opitutales bacterium]